MRTVNGYLSRRAQGYWPGALVVQAMEDGREQWLLERAGEEPLGLGRDFSEAHQAVHALIAAERQARKAGETS